MGSREQFEEFWNDQMNTELMDLHRCEFPMVEPDKQPYACHETNRAWITWQESRATVGIVQPSMRTAESYPPIHNYGPADMANEYRRGHLDLLVWVKAAGIKVRDK